MTKLIRLALLALSMMVTAASSLTLQAQDDKRDAGDKAGDATEKALEKAGDGAEKGLDAVGIGLGAAVEHTTRGSVKAGKAIGDFFDDDVDRDNIDQKDVKEVQQALMNKGYYNGPIDGIAGGKTRSGVKEFQQDENLPATGRINAATLERLAVK
jgi:peptidoglycan hydrolase-like protein with peptidoglycan-binding domain